jgi:hypothetical protein
MKSMLSTTALPKFICASGLLFLSVIYGSCNQPLAKSQPDKPVVKDTLPTETPLSAGPVETVANSLDGPINSPEETVRRYDQLVTEYREIAKAFNDTSTSHAGPVPYALIQKMKHVRESVDPAVRYFSQHRKEFSKEQVKQVLNDTDEIAAAASTIK